MEYKDVDALVGPLKQAHINMSMTAYSDAKGRNPTKMSLQSWEWCESDACKLYFENGKLKNWEMNRCLDPVGDPLETNFKPCWGS